MTRNRLIMVLTVAVFLTGIVLFPVVNGKPVWCQEPAAVMTLESTEIEDEEAAGDAVTITAEQVEEARETTSDRIYGLVGLWALIAVVIYIVRFQVKDDERLYRTGYYNRDIE